MLIESGEEIQPAWIVPERQLWYAVLRRAAMDVQGTDIHYPNASLEAYEWVNDDSIEPRSFTWICEMLDLDTAQIRAKINSLYEANHGRRD